MQASYSGSNRSVKYLFENATEVSVEQVLTSGTPIATVTVDGDDVNLYAPAGGGGTTVVANPAGEPTDDLDTVQIGNVVYNIPGSGGGSGAQSYLSDYYSTEERVVGRWTDGKPLYQNTYDLGSAVTINADSWYNTGISSGDIERIIEVSNGQAQTTNTWPLGSAIDSGTIRLLNERNNNITLRWFTIQYTKSTDAPGTGPTPGNLIYLPALYSEEEREVGVWTDGKPLYQKTWDFSSSPIAINGGNQWQTLSGVSTVGMSEIIKAECVDYHGTSFNLYVALDGDNYTHAVVNSQINITMYLMRLTLTYTKTADQPGSGKYLPDGQYAHHYSTSEHIVGTWIDGSTIYERTWTGLSITTDTSWHSTGIDVSFANRIIGGTSIDNAGQVITESYAHPGYNDLLARSMFAGNTIATITLQYTKSS